MFNYLITSNIYFYRFFNIKAPFLLVPPYKRNTVTFQILLT